MKKTLLTLVAVGFGVSVSFAQVNPEETTQETQTMEQTDQMYQDDQGRKQVEMAEVPSSVQDAFKNGQYKDWEVLAIYEVSVTPEGEATATEGQKRYEFEVASANNNAAAGEQGEAVEGGMEGIEKEQVSALQPELILVFDENGQLVQEEQPEEEIEVEE